MLRSTIDDLKDAVLRAGGTPEGPALEAVLEDLEGLLVEANQ